MARFADVARASARAEQSVPLRAGQLCAVGAGGPGGRRGADALLLTHRTDWYATGDDGLRGADCLAGDVQGTGLGRTEPAVSGVVFRRRDRAALQYVSVLRSGGGTVYYAGSDRSVWGHNLYSHALNATAWHAYVDKGGDVYSTRKLEKALAKIS